jgi:D-glycerate 3-kinase
MLRQWLEMGRLDGSARQQLAAEIRFGLQVCPKDLPKEPPSDCSNDRLEQRLTQFRQLYSRLQPCCQQQFGWQDCPIDLLWYLWIPLAEQLIQWRSAFDRPLIQGILGMQGIGKTTLTQILTEILRHWGYQVCHFSIDDLYLAYRERQQLQQVDPRFRWRGPPGTHDVQLGLQLLQQFRQSHFPVALPQFDKALHQGAGDRIAPVMTTAADIVLFEGWFVGVRPIAMATTQLPPLIATAADRDFALEINRRLHDYLPLWDQLDRLIALIPTDYHLSQQWRLEAEQRLVNTHQSGMSATEVRSFVEYFWKALHPELFLPPLLQAEDRVDWVIQINADHRLEKITVRPSRTPG